MELIQDWKTLQRIGNGEFERGRWKSASQCYLHSIFMLRQHLPVILRENPQEATQIIICLSIAVQNLADTYYHQGRVKRCSSLLKRALVELQERLASLPSLHPAAIALLRESCQLRQRLLMLKASTDPATSSGNATTSPKTLPRPLLH